MQSRRVRGSPFNRRGLAPRPQTAFVFIARNPTWLSYLPTPCNSLNALHSWPIYSQYSAGAAVVLLQLSAPLRTPITNRAITRTAVKFNLTLLPPFACCIAAGFSSGIVGGRKSTRQLRQYCTAMPSVLLLLCNAQLPSIRLRGRHLLTVQDVYRHLSGFGVWWTARVVAQVLLIYRLYDQSANHEIRVEIRTRARAIVVFAKVLHQVSLVEVVVNHAIAKVPANV